MLTFRESADVFGQRSQTRVVLLRKALTVQSFGPCVSVTGQHGCAAVPYGPAHATTGLNKPTETQSQSLEEKTRKL